MVKVFKILGLKRRITNYVGQNGLGVNGLTFLAEVSSER